MWMSKRDWIKSASLYELAKSHLPRPWGPPIFLLHEAHEVDGPLATSWLQFLFNKLQYSVAKLDKFKHLLRKNHWYLKNTLPIQLDLYIQPQDICIFTAFPTLDWDVLLRYLDIRGQIHRFFGREEKLGNR